MLKERLNDLFLLLLLIWEDSVSNTKGILTFSFSSSLKRFSVFIRKNCVKMAKRFIGKPGKNSIILMFFLDIKYYAVISGI